MHIVIDCFKQIKGKGKSIGIYNLSLNLVKNLALYKNKSTDPTVKKSRITVIGNRHNEEDFRTSDVSFVCINNYDPLNQADCLIWELFSVRKVADKISGDVIIFPRGYSTLNKIKNDIVIIHDMIPFYYHEKYPKYFGGFHNYYIMNRLKSSARKCNKLITISESSKSDIIKYTGIQADKIHVIHNGLNPVVIPEKETKKGEYILTITSELPHKNLTGIIRSYDEYCKKSNNPIDIYIIGVSNYDKKQVSVEYQKRIHCIKYIDSDREMHEMLANASLFLFLSLYEGFGFPPLEAMQAGVPVICSNRTSLPEIVGNAAKMVDPENYIEVGEIIQAILSDKKKKTELIKCGYENIQRYEWNSIAEAYWSVIKDGCSRD